MADSIIEIGVLNIKASPHPDGIYPKVLHWISDLPIVFHGDDVFAIKPPERVEGGFYRGRMWIWTEVDPNKPAIDKKKLQELSQGDAEASLNTNVGLNLKVFLYVLRERDHLLFFESKNDLGQHLAPSRLAKVLNKLFMSSNARRDIHVDVNIVPEEDALERILSIPMLTKLQIEIHRPNADDNTDKFAEVMRDLEAQGVGEKVIEYKAISRKKGITPSDETRELAEVAALSGVVKGVGKDKKTKTKLEMSTEEYPKKIVEVLQGIANSSVAILRVAKNATIGRRKPSGSPT